MKVTEQQFKKFIYIGAAASVAMLAHTVEEAVAHIWTIDPFMIYASQHLDLSGAWVYASIQAFALAIIIVFLARVSVQKFDRISAFLLGILFLGELSHPIVSTLTYYPGLYTGIVLVVIGIFYFVELLKANGNNKV